MSPKYKIDPDITKAETLPSAFYKDAATFEQLKEDVFVKSWQWVGDDKLVPFSKSVHPFFYMEHFLDEPAVLVRGSDDEIICHSNVCTHRGNILVNQPGTMNQLQCMYHGRRFSLDGKFEFMPEFKEAQDFPRPCEDLRSFQLRRWSQMLFVSLEPSFDFSEVIAKMEERTYFMPLSEFKHDAVSSKDYLIHCHWALYCDNYLEGFHIPFVHHDLNESLNYGDYTTEIYDHCNLQIGYTDDATDTFDLPVGHPDHGRNVAAYYYWVYPNMMFNFYPWGLSINVVKPISQNRTRVSFITYVYDESKMASGAGAFIDKVEREDEFVVEGVHRGLKSRYYTSGRFSPKREKGVHHFHQLLAGAVV